MLISYICTYTNHSYDCFYSINQQINDRTNIDHVSYEMLRSFVVLFALRYVSEQVEVWWT